MCRTTEHRQGESAPWSAAATPPATAAGGAGAVIDLKRFAEIASELETAFGLVGRDPRGARRAARNVVRMIELSTVAPDVDARVVTLLWRSASMLQAGAAKVARGLDEGRIGVMNAGTRMVAAAAALVVDLEEALDEALQEHA